MSDYHDYAVTITCDDDEEMDELLQAIGGAKTDVELTVLEHDRESLEVAVGGNIEGLARELTDRAMLANAEDYHRDHNLMALRKAKCSLRAAQREVTPRA